MNILVTGGAGFIGSHIVDRLTKEKHEVTVIDNLSTGKRENIHKKARFQPIDITSRDLQSFLSGDAFDIIIHLAAQKSVKKSIKNPQKDAQINIDGTLNLLKAIKQHRLKQFIFFSTGGAMYGDNVPLPTPESQTPEPASPYGIAKLAVEHYIKFYHHVYNLPYTILRCANVYGPRQDPEGEAGVISIFCRQILEQKPLIVYGDGQQTRDYIYVDDVVDAVIQTMGRNTSDTYNLGTEKETSVLSLIEHLQKIEGGLFPTIHQTAIAGEQRRSVLLMNKAKRNLSWQPRITLSEGISRTWQWFKKNTL